MPGRTEARALPTVLRALTLFALLVLAGPVLGQEGGAKPAADDSPAAAIDKLIADPDKA